MTGLAALRSYFTSTVPTTMATISMTGRRNIGMPRLASIAANSAIMEQAYNADATPSKRALCRCGAGMAGDSSTASAANGAALANTIGQRA